MESQDFVPLMMDRPLRGLMNTRGFSAAGVLLFPTAKTPASSRHVQKRLESPCGSRTHETEHKQNQEDDQEDVK
jgi:hypothetical protein